MAATYTTKGTSDRIVEGIIGRAGELLGPADDAYAETGGEA